MVPTQELELLGDTGISSVVAGECYWGGLWKPWGGYAGVPEDIVQVLLEGLGCCGGYTELAWWHWECTGGCLGTLRSEPGGHGDISGGFWKGSWRHRV